MVNLQRSRQQASMLRSSWWSWATLRGPNWTPSTTFSWAVAVTCFISCSLAFANESQTPKFKSTRDILLETYKDSPNADCKSVLNSNSNNLTLSYENIDERIRMHRFSKTGENRIKNELFLQYTTDILVLSRTNLTNLARRLTALWTAAQSEEITDRVKEAQAAAAAQLDHRGKPQTFMPDYFYSLPYYFAVFPSIAKVIEKPELASRLSSHGRAMLTTGEPPLFDDNGKVIKRSGEPGRHIGKRFKLSLSKEVEGAVRADMIGWKFKQLEGALLELSSTLAATIEKDLVSLTEYRPNVISSWQKYMSFDGLSYSSVWFRPAANLIREFLLDLEQSYPVSPTNKKWADIAELKSLIESFDEVRDPYKMLGATFNEATNTLQLVERGAVVQYNEELATTELVPAKVEGMVKALQPVTHAMEGAGTNKSSGASYRSLVGVYAGNGAILHAMDHTDAATGVMLGGEFFQKLTYTDRALQNTKQRFALPVNGITPPLTLSGRSIGGTVALFYYLMFPDTVADQVVGISTSIPFTLPPQIANVFRQAEANSINGVVEGALDDATAFSRFGLDLLERAYERDKTPFKLAGNRWLGFQGVSDEDARVVEIDQLDAVAAAKYMRNRFMPLGHLVILTDPLTKYGGRFDLPQFDEIREAAHFLEASAEDMTLREVETNPDLAAFRGLPEEDLPKRRSQLEKIFLHKFGHLDYLVNGLPGGHPWPDASDRESQARLRAYRDFIAPGTTFVEIYLDHLNRSNGWRSKRIHVTLEDIMNAKPGRKTKAEYFSEVYTMWFVKEPQRVLQIYQEMGVIPK